MADMIFNADLLPSSDLGNSLGSSGANWNIYGTLYGNADSATRLSCFSLGTGTWGILTGTSIIDFSDGSGGDMDFRKNCPSSGLISFKVDGRFYLNEGLYMCLDTLNYTSYAPTLTGSGASGTWGINISGNADTVDGYHHNNFKKLSNTYSIGVNGDGGWIYLGRVYLPNAYNGGELDLKIGSRYYHLYDIIIRINTGTPAYGTSSISGYKFTTRFESHTVKYIKTTGTSNYDYYDLYIYLSGWDTIYWKVEDLHNISFSPSNTSSSSLSWTGEIGYYNLTTDHEIVVTNCNSPYGLFRMILGNYGAFLRNDGANTYLLLTNSGNLYGVWNDLRPIYVNNSSGIVYCGLGLYGAVWNDYAEFRETKEEIKPGYCVIENGDDTLSLSIERLQPGAEIVSDTFGFAIGETDECKTPIAATGRVLAYTYEDREIYRLHIGEPVCSGPNGTVSLMTDEEYTMKGYCAIGFVSAVPDYDEWGTGKVKVDGRVWIRIR